MKMSQGLLPTDTLDSIRKGCLESTISRFSTALGSPEAKKLYGGKDYVETLATFTESAVVKLSDGDVVRVHLGTTHDGTVLPLRVESVGIKALTEDDFALARARHYVDSWMTGKFKEANRTFSELVPVVDDRRGVSQEKVVEAVTLFCGSERGWRKQLCERRLPFSETIKTAKPLIEAVVPKFSKLYGQLTESVELEAYRSLVTADLSTLRELFGVLAEAVDKAYASYRQVSTKIPRTDESICVFESFATDYVRDARAVCKMLGDVANLVGRVDLLAQTHDSVANMVEDYETAGRFVELMSRRLVEAATEEN